MRAVRRRVASLALVAAVPLALVLLLPTLAQADAASRRTPVVAAVERVAPSTVNITSTQQVRRGNPFFRGDPVFERFFGRFLDPRPRTAQSLGTGVLIGDGFVLTNEHVLAGSMETRITLADGREFAGELIGADPNNDLAVLRVRTDEKLPSAPLGNSEDVLIGETVIAIGNPFGLNHTVTTGVLSAVQRSIQGRQREYHGFLQTDASINPGNSGGPLVNVDGEVIGVNTAILGEAEGIGFAIPINRARRIVEELIEHGEVAPTWLGVRLQEITPALRTALEIRAGGGVLVSHVFSDTPAERAGVQRGDVIVELEGTRVRSRRGYFEILRGLTDGDRTRAVLERNGDSREVDLVAEAFPEDRAEDFARILLGISVSELTPDVAVDLGLRAIRGLLVREVQPRSSADFKGLRAGDVILKMNQDSVETIEAFRRAVTRLRGRSQVLLLVMRGRNGYYVTLELP